MPCTTPYGMSECKGRVGDRVPTLKYEVDTRRLDAIMKRVPGSAAEVNKRVGFLIEGHAKSKSPVDTGANKSSIYTATKDQDNYVPREGSHPLPKPAGNVVHVGPSMEYSFFLEFGTRHMAARPFLMPAVEEVARRLGDMYAEVVSE